MKNLIHVIIAIITFLFSYHFSGESRLSSYDYKSNPELTIFYDCNNTGIPLLSDERNSYLIMEHSGSSHCLDY